LIAPEQSIRIRRFTTVGAAGELRVESLGEVVEEVVRVFEADGEAHHGLVDAPGHAGGRVDLEGAAEEGTGAHDEGFRVAEADGAQDDAEAVHEAVGAVVAGD